MDVGFEYGGLTAAILPSFDDSYICCPVYPKYIQGAPRGPARAGMVRHPMLFLGIYVGVLRCLFFLAKCIGQLDPLPVLSSYNVASAVYAGLRLWMCGVLAFLDFDLIGAGACLHVGD